MIKANKLFISIALFIVSISFTGCKMAPVIGGEIEKDKLVDGIYEGEYKGGLNNAVVKVTVKNNKIVDIEIVKHNAMKGKKAEPVIPARIIEKQSTRIDAVTGATNSSRVIMNAVQKAIEKSYSTEGIPIEHR